MATRQTADFPSGGVLTDTMLDNEFQEIYTNITDTNVAADANIAIYKTRLGTYTAWATWTPTLTSTGGTFTSTAAPLARWTQVGKIVTASIVITGTAAGNLVIVHFTPPVTPSQNTSGYVTGSASMNAAGVPYVGHVMYDWLGSTTKFSIQREIQAVIGAGALTIACNVVYEVA